MSRRKPLAIIVVSLVGLLAVWHAALSLVIEPYRDLQRDIARKSNEAKRYQATMARIVNHVERWQALGARTLSVRPVEALLLFDKEIKRLLQAHGLQRASVRPKAARALKNGLIRVPYSVQAEGKLKNIVELMVSIYELPYVARVNTLRLSPVSAKRRDQLSLNMDVETVVLPESEIGGPIEPVEVKGTELPRVKRYAKEDGQAYAMIYEKDFFQKYVKPPPPTAKPKPGPKPPDEPPPPPPPPSPPPPRDNSVIVALLSYPGQQEVITVKPGRKEREIHRLGDEIGGGILRMVHPFGAVIGIDGQDYVYPPGAALDKDDQRVPASEVPQIMKALGQPAPDEADQAPETAEAGDVPEVSDDSSGDRGEGAEDEAGQKQAGRSEAEETQRPDAPPESEEEATQQEDQAE